MRGRYVKTFLLLGIALMAYVYFVEIQGERRRSQLEQARAQWLTTAREEIQHLELQPRQGTPLALARGARGWSLARPVEDRADPGAMDKLLEALSQSKVQRRMIPVGPLSDFGLEPPAWKIRITGPRGTEEVWMGQEDFSHRSVYSKKPAESEVLVLPDSVRTALEGGMYRFRNKSILAFDRQKVRSLQLKREGQRIRFEKRGPSWYLTVPVKDGVEVEKLDALLNSLQYGEVAAFISEGGSPLQPYGLDRPGVEVELTDEAGRRLLLKVGRRRDPSDPPPVAAADTSNPTYYALDESRPQVLAIFDVLYTQLREALFYFREKILWDIEPDQVETVRLRNRKGTYEFYRDPSSQWKVRDPASFRDQGVRWYKLFAAIDRVPVTDKIDRYENLRGFGLHDPDVRVEVRSGGETRGFSGGRSPSGGCYLKRDDSPTVMSVDAVEYAELEFSLPELLEPSESGAASQGAPASEKMRRPGSP